MLRNFFKKDKTESPQKRVIEEVSTNKPVERIAIPKLEVAKTKDSKKKVEQPYKLPELLKILHQKDLENNNFYRSLNHIKGALSALNSSDILKEELNKIQKVSFEIDDNKFLDLLTVEDMQKIKLVLAELSNQSFSKINLDHPLQVKGIFELYFWNQLMTQPKFYICELANDYFEVSHSLSDKTFNKQYQLSHEEVKNKLDKRLFIWDRDIFEKVEIVKLLDAIDEVVSSIQS